jgi:hypothetical protein
VLEVGEGGDASPARSFATHIPLFWSGLRTLARRLDEPGSAAGLLVTYTAAAMLAVLGFAVVRLLPKKETSR